jgi:hypothetical protein
MANNKIPIWCHSAQGAKASTSTVGLTTLA